MKRRRRKLPTVLPEDLVQTIVDKVLEIRQTENPEYVLVLLTLLVDTIDDGVRPLLPYPRKLPRPSTN